MVAKQQEVVDKLRSTDRSTRLKAVRDIKNQIIGNKNKKLSYIKLDAVPRVVELLQESADAHLIVQSAAAVGSFAYGLEDGFRAVLASGGVQHLLQAVSSQDDSVVEAALRALKLVWQSPGASQPHQLDDLNLDRIVSLLSSANPRTSEIATQVLAEYCQSAQSEVTTRLAQDASVGPALMQLVTSQSAGREAAAAALALLSSKSSSMAAACSGIPQWQPALLPLLKHPTPATRLAACICLQNISANIAADDVTQGNKIESVHRAMLPVLLKLLHMPTVLEAVPPVLTNLLQRSPAMQKAANDSDAVSSLTTLLHHEHTWHNRPRFKEGILRALSILCRNHVDARWSIVQRASLAQLAKALEDPDIKVCAAACACIQSLSGSMKCLRELSMAHLTPPVVRLLSLSDREVQLTALKALTNLMLDADSAKSCVAQSDGLANIVKMLSAPDAEARCSAMWALSHLVNDAAPAVCEAVMAALPWEQCYTLLQYPDLAVQEKTFMMLRNMATTRSAKHCIKQWSQGAVVPALVAILQAAQHPQQTVLPEQVVLHILKTLVNFAATGGEEERDAIAAAAGECIKAHLLHDSVEVRTAALWVIINLTEGSGDEPGGAAKRIQQFQSIGTEARLRQMLHDMSLDVRERVTSALDNFGCASNDNDDEMSFEDPIDLLSASIDGS